MTELLLSGAEFSEPDRIYRYKLWRRWSEGPLLMVVGLNPSTADETQDDPTVRRCIGYAKAWGYAGLMMTNAFAFRATNPKVMLFFPEPILAWSQNLAIIERESRLVIRESGAVLAAWGNHGSHRIQSRCLRQRLHLCGGGVACLGLTKSGEPKHPLYLAANTKPIPFIGDGGRLCREIK